MSGLGWIIYVILGGLVLWVLFAIRLAFALKRRARKKAEEQFEQRDN